MEQHAGRESHAAWLASQQSSARIRATERPLGDTDVLAARGLLSFMFKKEVTLRARSETALALDRTNLGRSA